MAIVKVFLGKGETAEDAKDALRKALGIGEAETEVQLKEAFDDPAIIDIAQAMESEHQKIYEEMIQEINDALDKDYV